MWNKEAPTDLGKIAFDASRKRPPVESGRSSGRSIAGITNAKVAASRKCKQGPRRAVGKLVRTDDGTGMYQSDGGQHSTFLLHTENDPSWKQYSRVRHDPHYHRHQHLQRTRLGHPSAIIHEVLFSVTIFFHGFGIFFSLSFFLSFFFSNRPLSRTAIQQIPTFINDNQFIGSLFVCISSFQMYYNISGSRSCIQAATLFNNWAPVVKNEWK